MMKQALRKKVWTTLDWRKKEQEPSSINLVATTQAESKPGAVATRTNAFLHSFTQRISKELFICHVECRTRSLPLPVLTLPETFNPKAVAPPRGRNLTANFG